MDDLLIKGDDIGFSYKDLSIGQQVAVSKQIEAFYLYLKEFVGSDVELCIYTKSKE